MMKQLHFWDRRQTEGIQGASGKQQVAIAKEEKTLANGAFRSEATKALPRGEGLGGGNVDWVQAPPAGRPGGIRTRKNPGPTGSDFRVWMTGLEPATSWSLTRCATNCATSRGPCFKGTANIGILFRKNKRRSTYFSDGLGSSLGQDGLKPPAWGLSGSAGGLSGRTSGPRRRGGAGRGR